MEFNLHLKPDVLRLVVTTTLLTTTRDVLAYFFPDDITKMAVDAGYVIAYFLIFPFAQIIAVIVYRQLKKRQIKLGILSDVNR